MVPLRWPRCSARTFCAETLETRIAFRFSPWAESFPTGTPATTHVAPPLHWGGAELAAPTAQAPPDSALQYIHDVLGTTGRGQTVAVIDTGIAYDHPALGGGLGTSHRVVGGWDFTEENDANPYDDGPAGFHGTHVAGIIASSDSRYLGLAPEADLVGLRVFNDQGWGSFEWIEQALQWVQRHRLDFDNPITTVNLSLGTEWNSVDVPQWSRLEDELAALEAADVVVIASAGNSFRKYQTPGLNYPAASDHVIAAASTNERGELSPFSQRIAGILAAPGENIVSTVPDYLYDFNGVTDDFAAASGTSMSAPYISGAAVLVREAMQRAGRTRITPQAIEEHLRQTADQRIDSATGLAFSQINLRRALESLLSASPPQDPSGPGDTTPTPPTRLDLGEATQATWQLTSQVHGAHFTLTAAHTGWLTLEWLGDIQAQISLRHPGGQEIIRTSPQATPVRWDLPVERGQSVELWLNGSDNTETLRVTNLVQMVQNRFTVHGSSTIDQLTVDLQGYSIQINGTAYWLGSNPAVQLELLDWQTADQLFVQGSAADETFALSANKLDITLGKTTQISLSGSTTQLLDGGAGRNVAHWLGSTQSEELWLQGSSATVLGTYRTDLRNFTTSEFAGEGGNDQVHWADSAGVDHFFGGLTESRMKGEGYLHSVRGFRRQTVDSQSGSDWAYLTGSDQDDELIASVAQTTFRSGNVQISLHGIDRIYSQAGRGGLDVARFEPSNAATDSLLISGEYAVLRGPDLYHLAFGFQTIDTVRPTDQQTTTSDNASPSAPHGIGHAEPLEGPNGLLDRSRLFRRRR